MKTKKFHAEIYINGGSLVLTIPKIICELENLKDKDIVEIELKKV